MSRGYSRIIIVGNLGQDAEMRYTPTGRAVTNFSVAVNRRRRSGNDYVDETDWYRVAVWGSSQGEGQADVAATYLRKGMKVLVDGELSLREWEDREGQKRISVDINADRFVMLTSREEMAAMEAGGGQGARPDNSIARNDSDDRGNFDDDDDLGDVPF